MMKIPNIQGEIEFYEFIQQRFEQMYRKFKGSIQWPFLINLFHVKYGNIHILWEKYFLVYEIIIENFWSVIQNMPHT